MRPATLLTACFLLVGLLVGCGGVPPTYYYRIDYELSNSPTQNNGAIPITIGIAQFSTDLLYETDKIVYRNSPYEVQFYHYRRWVAPPKKIVTEKIYEQFRASGAFQRVVRIPSTFKMDYLLKGRILEFEELDEGVSWYGVVSLEFQLQDPETSEIVWERVISERTPALKKEPAEVVKAISESFYKVVSKSIEEVKAGLRSKNI